MTWTLGEGLATTLLAKLQSDMAAKLGALNTEYATTPEDGNVLPDVQLWLTSEQELQRIHSMPAVFVLADQATFHTTRSSLTIEPEVSVRIGILVEDVEPDRLRLRAYRYGRAVAEIITDALVARTLDEWTPSTEMTLEYSPILAHNSAFIIDATLSATFTKSEDR